MEDEKPEGAIYCCKRCRQPLFRGTNLSSHEPSQHDFSFRRQAKDRSQTSGSGSLVSSGPDDRAQCTSFFLEEAVQWMKARPKALLHTALAV